MLIKILLAGSIATASQSPADLYEAGKFAQSEAAYQNAVNKDEFQAAMHAKQLAKDLLGLGRALAAQKKYEQAQSTLVRAMKLTQAMNLGRMLSDDIRSALADVQNSLPVTKQVAADDEVSKPVKSVPSSIVSSLGPVITYASPSLRQTRFFPQVMSNDGRASVMLLAPGATSDGQNWNVSSKEQEALERAEKDLKTALEAAEKEHGANSVAALEKVADLAQFYASTHKNALVLSTTARINAALEKLPPDQQQYITLRMLRYASMQAQQNRSADAQMLFSAITKSIKNLSIDSSTESQLSEILNSLRQTSIGEEICKLLIAHAEKNGTESDPKLASLRSQLASIYESQGKLANAIELYELTASSLEKAPIMSRSSLSSTLASLARLYLRAGNIEKAKQLVPRFIASQKSVSPVGRGYRDTITSTALSMAFEYAQREDYGSAEQLFTHAFSAAGVPSDRDDYWSEHDTFDSVKRLAQLFDANGHADLTGKLFDRYVESRQKQNDKKRLLTALTNEASYFAESGNMDRAKKTTSQSLELAQQLGCNNSFLQYFSPLAAQYERRTAYDDAIAIYQFLLKTSSACGSPKTELLREYRSLARAQSGAGKPSEAKQSLKSAFDMASALLPADPPELKQAVVTLFNATSTKDGTTAAERLLDDLDHGYLIWSSSSSSDPSHVNSLLATLAARLAESADKKQAEALARLALERQTKMYGAEDARTASIMISAANILRQTGQGEEAVALESKAKAIYDKARRRSALE